MGVGLENQILYLAVSNNLFFFLSNLRTCSKILVKIAKRKKFMLQVYISVS